MSYTATYFLEPHADTRAQGGVHPVLYVYPGGRATGGLHLQMPDSLPHADRVRIAETLLRGAQQFHDAVVADAERARTAADELAEAREEIARLRAGADAL